jgi:hypothetical protein
MYCRAHTLSLIFTQSVHFLLTLPLLWYVFLYTMCWQVDNVNKVPQHKYQHPLPSLPSGSK